jgi:hypothetical protein
MFKEFTTITAAIFFSFVAFAQQPIEYSISNFDTIKVFDLITVHLIKSSENKIIISGRDAEYVEHVQKNGQLKVRMQTDKIFKGEDTYVKVYYKEINTIDANEGAIIVIDDLIEQNQLEVKVQEGATIKASLKVKNLDIKAVTGGIIQLSGETEDQIVVVNTGGVVENSQLKTTFTKVKVQAGGEVEVYATQTVDININAGGNVMVYGNPQKVRKNTFLGGNITMVD